MQIIPICQSYVNNIWKLGQISTLPEAEGCMTFYIRFKPLTIGDPKSFFWNSAVLTVVLWSKDAFKMVCFQSKQKKKREEYNFKKPPPKQKKNKKTTKKPNKKHFPPPQKTNKQTHQKQQPRLLPNWKARWSLYSRCLGYRSLWTADVYLTP